jgi:hypothetical protein
MVSYQAQFEHWTLHELRLTPVGRLSAEITAYFCIGYGPKVLRSSVLRSLRHLVAKLCNTGAINRQATVAGS